MTNLPPPDPRKPQLGFDELVGIVVAFTAIGTILAWSLTHKDKNFNLNSLVPVPTPTGTKLPDPQAPQAAVSPTTPPKPSPTVLPGVLVLPQPTAPVTPVTPVNPTQETPKTASKIAPFAVPAPKTPASATPKPAKAKSPVRFSDVPKDYWALPYMAALTQRGIVNTLPNKTFRPNQPMTRAEFASQLQKAFEDKPTPNAPNFKDVPSKAPALPAIKETAKTGFLRGSPGNIFQPNSQISRVQALVAIANGIKLKPPASPEKILQNYQDAGQIPKYAITPVAAATQAGIVVNYPNQKLLNPNKPATRADVAAWIYQGLVKVGKAKEIPSKYIVKP